MPDTTKMGTPNENQTFLNEVLRAVLRRKDIFRLQTQLEEAWKEAAAQFRSLNEPFLSEKIQEAVLRKAARDGEAKRRKVSALAQESLLLFQTLTEEKHPQQMERAERIEESITAGGSPDCEDFLKKEAYFRVEFQRSVLQTQRQIKRLLKSAKTIRAIPCTIPKMDAVIDGELKLVEDFLKSTNQTLSKQIAV